MNDDFIIIAHRGASGDYPENTLLAFRKALEGGANWLELDVHLSADGALVVIHDETLERTTNGTGAVSALSLAELRQLDAGRGERIPRLEEVLDLACGRAKVNIELKGRGTAGPVADLLRDRLQSGRERPEDFLASSLYEQELILFAEALPAVPLAPVVDVPQEATWALAKRLDAWSVHVEKRAVDRALLIRARQQKRRLLVYTVNTPEEIDRFQGLGVAGVFTDFPHRGLQLISSSFRGR